jgi:ribosome-associated protein
MKNDLSIRDGIIIPHHELLITASKAGGPGGQHVNKTSSRISIRWNIKQSAALDAAQKERILQKLHARLTSDGEIIVHNNTSRSQQKNKEMALKQLAFQIEKALHVPKKRRKTRVPQSAQEQRLTSKARRGNLKKMRGGKHQDD